MRDIAKYKLKLVKDRDFTEVVGLRKYSASDLVEISNRYYELTSQAEELLILACIDTKYSIVGLFEVGRGGINGVTAHPRDILKRAVLCNAHAIVILHNHPSGELSPSKQDMQTTIKLRDACNIMGIRLLDHIIVGDYNEEKDKVSFICLSESGILDKGGVKKINNQRLNIIGDNYIDEVEIINRYGLPLSKAKYITKCIEVFELTEQDIENIDTVCGLINVISIGLKRDCLTIQHSKGEFELPNWRL